MSISEKSGSNKKVDDHVDESGEGDEENAKLIPEKPISAIRSSSDLTSRENKPTLATSVTN